MVNRKYKFLYAVSLNADWVDLKGKCTVFKFELSLWVPSLVCLPLEPAIFAFCKLAIGGIGGISIELIVSMLQTRSLRVWVSLNLPSSAPHPVESTHFFSSGPRDSLATCPSCPPPQPPHGSASEPRSRNKKQTHVHTLDFQVQLLLLLLLLIWQSPGLPGWRKVNLITVTRRPLHPSIAAGLYCLTTSTGISSCSLREVKLVLLRA